MPMPMPTPFGRINAPWPPKAACLTLLAAATAALLLALAMIIALAGLGRLDRKPLAWT